MHQGSVLAPLLFLLYKYNGLPSCVSCSLRLFADDCVVYREMFDSADVSQLQAVLNNTAELCSTCKMDLNVNKCKVMRSSRTNSAPADYGHNNTSLTSVTTYKYLGVYIASDLSWQCHSNCAINNANRSLCYLRRCFSKTPLATKLILYKSVVRSKLEYASSVWDPDFRT